jgi:hypothetical protein
VSRIRLYIDEDAMHMELVDALRAKGVDTITAVDAGLIQSPDELQLQYAAEHARVLYSFNVADFFQLHTAWIAASKPHAGMILARQQRYSVSDQLRRLLRLVDATSHEDMVNRVEFLSHWG